MSSKVYERRMGHGAPRQSRWPCFASAASFSAVLIFFSGADCLIGQQECVSTTLQQTPTGERKHDNDQEMAAQTAASIPTNGYVTCTVVASASARVPSKPCDQSMTTSITQ